MSEAKTTTNHNEIKKWVEERGGHPARVKDTDNKDGGGVLRIDYPGYSGEQELEEISWEEFFEKFDEAGLALLCQEKTAGGQRSNFNKLISRETAEAEERGESHASRRR